MRKLLFLVNGILRKLLLIGESISSQLLFYATFKASHAVFKAFHAVLKAFDIFFNHSNVRLYFVNLGSEGVNKFIIVQA